MLKFTMLLAGALILGCASTAPRDWRRVDCGIASFEAPSGLRKLPVMSEDAFVAVYEAPGLRIDVNSESVYGKRCPGPDTIRAVSTGRTPRDASYRKSLPYSTRLLVCSPGRKGISVDVYWKAQRGHADALHILESVVVR